MSAWPHPRRLLAVICWLVGLVAVCAVVAAAVAPSAIEHSDNAEETIAQRLERVKQMSAEEKAQLLRRQERFLSLAPAEQQRLRKLHHEIQQDPNAAQLREVMHHYYEWLKTLPEYRRAELATLEPKQRLAQIRKWRAEQASPRDLQALTAWLEQFGTRNEERYLATLPDESREAFSRTLSRWPRQARARTIAALMLFPWRPAEAFGEGAKGKMRPLADKEREKILENERSAALQELRSQLTAETRQRLEKLSPADQWRIIAEWLSQDFDRQRGMFRGPGGRPQVEESQLLEFFENELNEAERDYLLRLPGEKMPAALREMYFRKKFPFQPWRPAHDGPGRGVRPPGGSESGPGPKKPDGPGPGPRSEGQAGGGKPPRNDKDRPSAKGTPERIPPGVPPNASSPPRDVLPPPNVPVPPDFPAPPSQR